MSQSSNGFTLIEVMIVIAIIGVLAAVSIPLYQGYVAKTHLTRAVGELGQYRSGIEEALGTDKSVTNDAIGYVPSGITTGDLATDIATFNPDGSGHLQVTLGGNAHRKVVGVVVTYERSVEGRWECIVDASANPSGWSDMYLPSNCRL